MAQRHYDPILVEGRTWVYDYHHFEVINEETFQYEETVSKIYYTVMGDTVINGKGYRKVYRRGGSESRMTFFRAYREEGSHVYGYLLNSNEEYLLMEFDHQRFAETVLHRYRNSIEEVDSIFVNGRRFCRHQYVEKIMGFPSVFLILVEGIGFVDNGLILGMDYIRPNCVCDYSTFRECYDGDELIFRNTDFKAESASGIGSLTVSPVRHQETLFDLQGRRLKEAPQKGIYIEDGKKKVVPTDKKIK